MICAWCGDDREMVEANINLVPVCHNDDRDCYWDAQRDQKFIEWSHRAEPWNNMWGRWGVPMTRVNMWAVAVLWVCVICLVLGVYFMVRNDSSPLFLLPSIVMAAVAIINLREHWTE